MRNHQSQLKKEYNSVHLKSASSYVMSSIALNKMSFVYLLLKRKSLIEQKCFQIESGQLWNNLGASFNIGVGALVPKLYIYKQVSSGWKMAN